jgi:nucleoside-diphosphate-sugar epimerase
VPLASPDTPQQPHTAKGAIRAEMERRLAETPGLRALVLRAGDFFGPRAGNNWLSQGIVRPGHPVRSAMYPGRPDVGHAWAYLPDVGEAFARLLDCEAELAPFAVHHFAGHWIDGTGFVAALGQAAGTSPRLRRMPWKLLPWLAPFNPTFAEMIEMESFWRHPLRLDNASLLAAIGAEPRTPLVQALRVSLDAIGCLEQPASLGGVLV